MRAIPCAAVIDTGATAAVMTPSTVAGATAGSARRLAGIEAKLTCPEIEAINGAQARVAAVGTARASASQPGTRRAMRARNRGANTSSEPVAATDSAKPTLRDNVGSTKIRHSTAAHNAGSARRRRPVARASTATRPIAAARRTLACGRATITNPTIVSAPVSACARRPTPAHRATTSAAPKTMATFAPDTATMCVSPVVRKSVTRSGDNPDVSPSTRPGSNPPGSRGSGAEALRRPVLRCPATCCTNDGGPMSDGDPRASNTADSSSPGCGTLTRPTAVTRCEGCSDSQPDAVVSTTTGELIDTDASAVVTSTARADKTTSGRPNADPPDAADRCGSLVTTSTSVTEAWARASCGKGPR